MPDISPSDEKLSGASLCRFDLVVFGRKLEPLAHGGHGESLSIGVKDGSASKGEM